MKRLYIDLCVYNRPFDDQRQPRIKLETDIFLFLLEQIEQKMYHTVNSTVLEYENQQNPYIERKEKILSYLKMSREKVNLDKLTINRATILEQYGIPSIDALHLALSEKSKVDYFVTCDDTLVKKIKGIEIMLKINVVTLAEFVAKEEKQNANS
ncbi:MAG: PIN domain-containing protein [Elusimicrobiota bacterium]